MTIIFFDGHCEIHGDCTFKRDGNKEICIKCRNERITWDTKIVIKNKICKKHGLTEYRRYRNSKKGYTFLCVKCLQERHKKYMDKRNNKSL